MALEYQTDDEWKSEVIKWISNLFPSFDRLLSLSSKPKLLIKNYWSFLSARGLVSFCRFLLLEIISTSNSVNFSVQFRAWTTTTWPFWVDVIRMESLILSTKVYFLTKFIFLCLPLIHFYYIHSARLTLLFTSKCSQIFGY